MAKKAPPDDFTVDDIILNFDPEAPHARFRARGLEAASLSLSELVPHPIIWPHDPPTAAPLSRPPAESADLSEFRGYDAVVMTWTAAEAAALAALFTPNHLPSSWYEYRHDVQQYLPLVTGRNAPFNDSSAEMARYYHSLGLYFPCTIGPARVLLFKSGLHFAYDGPAVPLKKLVAEIVEAVKPKMLITTGTAGGIGKDTSLGDIVIGRTVRFDCTTQFAREPWAKAKFETTALPAGTLAAITPPLLEVNAARLPGDPKLRVWDGKSDDIVTTDFFGFDDSTDYYQLQGLGRVCEMGDAVVGQAMKQFADVKWYAIRNASDPQIPNPSHDIEAANKQAGEIYSKYGAFTTAGSVIATWAVISSQFKQSARRAQGASHMVGNGSNKTNANGSLSHVELPGSLRVARRGAAKVRPIDPDHHVEVTLTLHGSDLPATGEQETDGISAEQFGQRYGASEENIRRVEEALRSYGLQVVYVAPTRQSLKVAGTAAAVEAAFQPEMAIYRSADQGEYRGRAGAVHVPAGVEGIVSGVFGLDQRRVAHRKAVKTPAPRAGKAKAVAAGPLSPDDLEKRYAFPRSDAKGQTVAIAEFGTPVSSTEIVPPLYLPGDVDTFCRQFGRTPPEIQIVPLNMAPLTPEQYQQLPPQLQSVAADEAVEVMMDVEIVAALCPKAKVLVYFASFDEKGWIDLLDRVTSGSDGELSCVSISWGEAEDAPDWSAAARTEINRRLQTAAMMGITVCVSAGDDGSGDGQPGPRGHIDFPASSPFVLAVGGTMLDGGGDELTWWESPGRRTKRGGGATGGGVSVVFDRPAWQKVKVKSINPGAIDGRVIPDVAALAGAPLYQLIFDGQPQPNGGTSASAPLWASLIARVYTAAKLDRPRFLTPLFYQSGGKGKPLGQLVCRDIVRGQNASYPQPGKGYSATAGYDAVTGWGVPEGTALVAALRSVPTKSTPRRSSPRRRTPK